MFQTLALQRPRLSRPRYVFRSVLQEWDGGSVPSNLIETLLNEYQDLVECITAPDAGARRVEFAFGRLLGLRGVMCRLCPAGAVGMLPLRTIRVWNRAESLLREYLSDKTHECEVRSVLLRVEEAWILSSEAYLNMLVSQGHHVEAERQLGLLKSIDLVALHIAQREIFRQERSVSLPLVSAHAIKLRMRLLALYIVLHASQFQETFPLIQAYRETFRIYDPAAYPWWFMDQSLTERQLAWTFRRMETSELRWRF